MSTLQGDFSSPMNVLPNRADYQSNFRSMLDQMATIYGKDLTGRFDFVYDEIPGRGPALSENASVEYWNDILEGLERFYHEYRDSLGGVIIFHGTDTMSYAAPFLLFRIENLHFPVILTGANLQPSIQKETATLDTKTDAWENLFNTLLFITTHGTPGVYVSFASRICLPFNLRKVRRQTTRTRARLRSISEETYTETWPEPTHLYRFENINLSFPYLARLVDGEFVFSASLETVKKIYASLNRGGLTRFRKVSIPGSSCFLHKISPALFPFFKDATWINGDHTDKSEPLLNLSLVILEGYKSGTLPTEHENSILSFCNYCGGKNIPIVLTTRYGLQEAEYGSTGSLPFLFRPRMMISETALAAAYHVIDETEEVLKRDAKPELTISSNQLLSVRRLNEIQKRLVRIERLFSSIRLDTDIVPAKP